MIMSCRRAPSGSPGAAPGRTADERKKVQIPILSGYNLFNLYKSGLESEKRRFLLEIDEKSSLHLEIGMIILYSLKVASSGDF